MHFWIDKRSSYGIGHNRSMAGHSYQHRRIRSKSIVTPVRHHPSGVPSTSQQHAKSHLHHHRNRHLDLDHRPTAVRIQHHSTPENPALQSNTHILNNHRVPVIHSVYAREELSVNHLVDPIESSRRSNCIANHWLPIYLKCGICVATALTLLTLKLYYDNDLTGLQLLTFGSTSIMLLAFSITITFLRMRRNRLMQIQRVQHENFEPVIQPVINNRIREQSIEECVDPPPPYAVAVRLPEKHATIDCSPPPSYEKINII